MGRKQVAFVILFASHFSSGEGRGEGRVHIADNSYFDYETDTTSSGCAVFNKNGRLSCTHGCCWTAGHGSTCAPCMPPPSALSPPPPDAAYICSSNYIPQNFLEWPSSHTFLTPSPTDCLQVTSDPSNPLLPEIVYTQWPSSAGDGTRVSVPTLRADSRMCTSGQFSQVLGVSVPTLLMVQNYYKYTSARSNAVINFMTRGGQQTPDWLAQHLFFNLSSADPVGKYGGPDRALRAFACAPWRPTAVCAARARVRQGRALVWRAWRQFPPKCRTVPCCGKCRTVLRGLNC